MNNNIPTSKEEDFLVKATLVGNGNRVVDVPCKIYLPETPMDKPYFILKPLKQQYDILTKIRHAEFEAQIDGNNRKKIVYITSPSVYLSAKKTRFWGPGVSESKLKGEPQTLKIVERIGINKPEKSNDTVHLRIWISPNSFLEPDLSPEYSFNGEVKYTRFSRLKFSITDKLTIEFDKNFNYSVEKGKSVTQTSYLVASAKINTSLIIEESIERKLFSSIDLFLKLASFGSRTRTTCIGFDASSNEQITRFYRSNFSFPSGKSEFLINCAFPEDFKGSNYTEGLVEKNHFGDFLLKGYKELSTHPSSKIICEAINSIVPGRKRTLEESFLSMFSSLESLILDFRKREKLEYVIYEKEDWAVKKSEIRDAIKKIFTSYSKDQRAFVYCKIEELNRIPLRIVFEKFCSKYQVDISDLWPVFGGKDTVGLSDIRNKLIHGENISKRYIHMLAVSEECLQYTLERMILSILKFPVKNTDVSKSKIANDPYRSSWSKDDMKEFFDYIK